MGEDGSEYGASWLRKMGLFITKFARCCDVLKRRSKIGGKRGTKINADAPLDFGRTMAMGDFKRHAV